MGYMGILTKARFYVCHVGWHRWWLAVTSRAGLIKVRSTTLFSWKPSYSSSQMSRLWNYTSPPSSWFSSPNHIKLFPHYIDGCHGLLNSRKKLFEHFWKNDDDDLWRGRCQLPITVASVRLFILNLGYCRMRDLANKIRKFGFCFMEHLTQFSWEVNPPIMNVIFNPLTSAARCRIYHFIVFSNQTPLHCIALLM